MTMPTDNKRAARPPIVVVVGHIDHGKTTILDWYRNTKVVEKETGGITQHIGAYEVEHKGRRLTFIDTPGHESFAKIRQRGTQLADIGILVVAADEGVKPQTKEAIRVLREVAIPFAVALNKMDKQDVNAERIKQELANEEVLVESYGGKVPLIETSGRTGQGLDDLLETLLLLAELEELPGDPDEPAQGIIIETQIDPRRGATATALIRNGTVKKGDVVVIGATIEIVRILENFAGRPTEELGPSAPARIAGLSKIPAVGDMLRVFPSRSDAQAFIESFPPEKIPDNTAKPIVETERKKRTFNIILKSDVFGSQEALIEALTQLSSQAVTLRLLSTDIGDINESDIKLAAATRLVTVVGFRVKIDATARELARTQNIRIATGEVIYELLDQVKQTISGLIPPEIKRIDLGRVKILKIFKKENGKQIIGGRVETGKIVKGAQIEIMRMKSVIGTGSVVGLQRGPQAAEEATQSTECGIAVESRVAIQESDELAVYQEEITKVSF